MSPKRIQRKNPWQPTPAPDILQSRGLGNGKKIREPKLPTTSDILRTRPFAPRNQDVSTPEDTRSFSEKITGAEFRYNGVGIPTFAPSKESPTLQLQEVSEQDTQEESAAQIEENQPGWGVGTELSKPQSVGISPQSGTIQRLCDECAAEKEKEEEKQPETLQAKAEISEAKDYTQNTFSSIKGDEETQIWQPKNIGKLDAKIVARNELTQPSITKAKPSRIRAKTLDELVGKKETLPAGKIASSTEEVASGETTERHLPIQAKLTVGEVGDKAEKVSDANSSENLSKSQGSSCRKTVKMLVEAIPLSQQELANKQYPQNLDQLPGKIKKSQEKYNQFSLLDQFGNFADLSANQSPPQLIAGRRIQPLPGGDAILECINVRGVTFASWELDTTTSNLIDAVLMSYGLSLFFKPVNILRTDAGFVIPPSPTANGTVPPLQARQAESVTMWGSAGGAGTKDGWPHLFIFTIPEFEVECD